ncbi:MAG: ChaB family protein [Pseudomonadota bacterium]
MAKKQGVDMPSTLLRSSDKAQRTYAETLKQAEKTYGPGERAGRTAYSSLKHSFEKVDDHWEAKEHPGSSDSQAAKSGASARSSGRDSAGGVDAFGHSRAELLERARRLDIRGRSTMNKEALAKAIAQKQG